MALDPNPSIHPHTQINNCLLFIFQELSIFPDLPDLTSDEMTETWENMLNKLTTIEITEYVIFISNKTALALLML